MIHPIEVESYRILAGRVDLSRFPPGDRDIVARVIHATADTRWAETLVVDPGAVEAGVAALRAGAPVICDVEMVRHGISAAGVTAHCALSDTLSGADTTRAAAGMRLAARRHPVGAVVVVGCAPTALEEVLIMVAAGELSPSLVIGLPVGFVGAAASKEALRRSGMLSISNTGEHGGSAVAAAAVNALGRLADG